MSRCTSLGLRFGRGELVYDHAVPFKYLQRELLALSEVTTDTVRTVFSLHGAGISITTDENARLNKSGYKSKMPENWDGIDLLARYKAVDIDIVDNPTHRHATSST